MSTALSKLAAAATAAASGSSSANSSGCPWHPHLEAVYKPGAKLGRGCFATVYKAERRSDGLQVAIKAVEKNKLDGETAGLLQNELEVLQAVSEHPGIVTLLDSLDTDKHMFFVMDYVDGGPLLDRIVSRGNFSENDARVLLRAILLTLEFLADLGCVHRDIKPENILVDNYSKKWPVKLTDFGLSAKMQPDELLYQTLGTPLFVAPEILNGRGYDSTCDMWSLGVVLYLVLCGYPPFPYDSPDILINAIVKGEYSFPAPEWDIVSEDAKDAVRRMLEIDAHRRITPVEALAHPWFRAAQSTSDLPNSKLKSFNARRKLKASMVAVRTTVDFMKFLDPKRNVKQNTPTQEELQEDVERNRALLQRLGIKETGTPSPDKDKCQQQSQARTAPELPQTSLKQSRRSLVLPVSIFEAAPLEHSQYGGGCAMMQSTDSIPWNSQVMSSRAKALVAEVKGSPVVEDNANPFLLPASVSEERTEPRKPKKLVQLDLNGLGPM